MSSTFETVREVLGSTLQLGERRQSLSPASGRMGEIPEFDSMAVLAVVTALEEEFDILFEDEDITAEMFETVGSLVAAVDARLTG